MVPPVALLLAVPLYVVVMSLPLYDLGPPGGGGGVLSHTTEFHLVPILAVAYLVAQSVPSARWWRAPCAWQARGRCSSTSTA